MSPSDFRSLIAIGRLSNREAAAALGLTDDRTIRRFKSGEEQPPPEIEARLIAFAAELLAEQMVRSLNLAAAGKVNLATLRVSESAITVESELSAAVARAVRTAVLERLASAGLQIERTHH